jgi:hypothetical protein
MKEKDRKQSFLQNFEYTAKDKGSLKYKLS